MARIQRPRYVGQTQIATASNPITTSQLAPSLISNGMPTGDLLAVDLNFRLSGNLNLTASVAGSIVTDGEKVFLRSLALDTDKHGVLVQGVDGVFLDRYNRLEYGTAPAAAAISSAATGTPAYSMETRFPFALPSWAALRPYDSILDVLLSRITARVQLGVATDFISGGTYSVQQVQVANMDITAAVVDNPVTSPPEQAMLPAFMHTLEVIKVPISANATGYRISLPYGDRIYRKIFITQRNGSTFAELATVIASTGLVGLAVNGVNVVDQTPLAALQDINKTDYAIETMPTGVIVLDFSKTGRILDMLNVLTRQNGTVELIVDVLSVSNGQLWIGLDCFKPIPEPAQRQIAAARTA